MLYDCSPGSSQRQYPSLYGPWGDYAPVQIVRPKGRPRRQDVSEALKLEAEGKTRIQIYSALGKTTEEEKRALRDSMRMRKFRERRK
jgi:hypothetical protein